MTAFSEKGVVFHCGDNRLVGIAAIPDMPADIGVLFLVGGLQYRVGSHRQFTLLARSLAAAGVPSFRFDYTGMGDSEGSRRGFNEVQDDIAAAIDTFLTSVPGLSRVVLWGLCDAASSAMIYAHKHSQVVGIILLNPWVQDGQYSPEVKMSYYFRSQLVKRDFWRRLLSGKIKIMPAVREFAHSIFSLMGKRSTNFINKPPPKAFIQDMLKGMQKFRHGVLIILSGNDFTAREFSTLISNESDWGKVVSRPDVTVNTVSFADHTFSRKPWMDAVSQFTIDWVRQR